MILQSLLLRLYAASAIVVVAVQASVGGSPKEDLPASDVAPFQPHRVSFSSLLNSRESSTVVTELKESMHALATQGMLVVTNVPDMGKHALLQSLVDCIEGSATSNQAVGAQTFTFEDGTRRKTLATHTTLTLGQEPLFKDETKPFLPTPCQEMDKASSPFRRAVASTTQLVANRLSKYLGGDEAQTSKASPLLRSIEAYQEYASLADIVKHGEHLEHFHSYEKTTNNLEQETLEMHTDQGLMIAFTPGQWLSVGNKHNHLSTKSQLSSGFYIELPDGTVTEVDFESTDDLVFMLGDGVNQYINTKQLPNGQRLRAVPHMLRMESSETMTRAWYGRMMLPPPDAVEESSGKTFEDLRQALIDSSLQEGTAVRSGLGCSGHQVARDLSATTCEDNQLYCWHRCMDFAEFELTSTTCSDQGLDLVCTNPRGLLSDGQSHGDYFLGCLNATSALPDSPYPTLPDFPRDEEACLDQDYETLVAEISQEFDHKAPLNGDATLFWTIENGKIKGKLAFNGLFGWLAIGFADPDGEKNGMHGAKIIMAMPGDDYSAVDGLDLDLDPVVNEFQIHPTKTAFRHWMVPLSEESGDNVTATARNSSPKDYSVEETACHVVLSFTTDSIHNQKFNLDGTDEMVWAANNQDFYMGYHGFANRARFTIDWMKGTTSLDDDAQDRKDTQGSSSAQSLASPAVNLFWAALAMLGLFYEV